MHKSESQVKELHETFFDIISKGDKDLIQNFLDINTNLNMSYLDENNQNGLFYVVNSIESDDLCISLLKFLISKGMDPLIIDKFKQTIVYYTCCSGLIKTTQWLLTTFRFNLDHCDVHGQTPVFYAVKENRIEMIQFLIAKGANKHHLDFEGLNCFYMIEDNNQVEMVLYLLSEKVDPNVKGKNGQTFVKKAEILGFFKIVNALNGRVLNTDAIRQKYVLVHKNNKKHLTKSEKENFQKKNPQVYRLLEDYEYLKQQMNENCSSDIVDINH